MSQITFASVDSSVGRKGFTLAFLENTLCSVMIHMNQCHKLKGNKTFSKSHRSRFPQAGDRIALIIDPRSPYDRPWALKWGYAPVFSNHEENIRVMPEPTQTTLLILPEPGVHDEKVMDELEILAKSVGGRNGGKKRRIFPVNSRRRAA